MEVNPDDDDDDDTFYKLGRKSVMVTQNSSYSIPLGSENIRRVLKILY